MFLPNILKDLLNLHYNGETELRNLSCKVHVFVIIYLFIYFIETYVSSKHFKRPP